MAVVSEYEALWVRVLEELRLQMTRATFDTWLRGTRLVAQEGDAWTIAVKNGFALDWLSNRLAATVERAASRITEREVTVRFVIGPPPAPESEPESEPDVEYHWRSKPSHK